MIRQKTRKHKRKQRGGAATPNAPKKQKRLTNYNIRPNSTVRQLINTFEPIKALNIQEGIQPTYQANSAKQQSTYNINQQYGKLHRSRKNTVTQLSAIRPQKHQALITVPGHKLKSQPQSQTIISKPKKLEYLTPNSHRFNIWSNQNLEEVN